MVVVDNNTGIGLFSVHIFSPIYMTQNDFILPTTPTVAPTVVKRTASYPPRDGPNDNRPTQG